MTTVDRELMPLNHRSMLGKANPFVQYAAAGDLAGVEKNYRMTVIMPADFSEALQTACAAPHLAVVQFLIQAEMVNQLAPRILGKVAASLAKHKEGKAVLEQIISIPRFIKVSTQLRKQMLKEAIYTGNDEVVCQLIESRLFMEGIPKGKILVRMIQKRCVHFQQFLYSYKFANEELIAALKQSVESRSFYHYWELLEFPSVQQPVVYNSKAFFDLDIAPLIEKMGRATVTTDSTAQGLLWNSAARSGKILFPLDPFPGHYSWFVRALMVAIKYEQFHVVSEMILSPAFKILSPACQEIKQLNGYFLKIAALPDKNESDALVATLLEYYSFNQNTYFKAIFHGLSDFRWSFKDVHLIEVGQLRDSTPKCFADCFLVITLLSFAFGEQREGLLSNIESIVRETGPYLSHLNSNRFAPIWEQVLIEENKKEDVDLNLNDWLLMGAANIGLEHLAIALLDSFSDMVWPENFERAAIYSVLGGRIGYSFGFYEPIYATEEILPSDKWGIIKAFLSHPLFQKISLETLAQMIEWTARRGDLPAFNLIVENQRFRRMSPIEKAELLEEVRAKISEDQATPLNRLISEIKTVFPSEDPPPDQREIMLMNAIDEEQEEKVDLLITSPSFMDQISKGPVLNRMIRRKCIHFYKAFEQFLLSEEELFAAIQCAVQCQSLDHYLELLEHPLNRQMEDSGKFRKIDITPLLDQIDPETAKKGYPYSPHVMGRLFLAGVNVGKVLFPVQEIWTEYQIAALHNAISHQRIELIFDIIVNPSFTYISTSALTEIFTRISHDIIDCPRLSMVLCALLTKERIGELTQTIIENSLRAIIECCKSKEEEKPFESLPLLLKIFDKIANAPQFAKTDAKEIASYLCDISELSNKELRDALLNALKTSQKKRIQ